MRAIRPLERAVSDREDDEACVVQGYCAAVRGALSDAGKAPLAPGGLRRHERLEQIKSSLQHAEQKQGARPKPLKRLHSILERALSATAASWPPLEQMFHWVHEAVELLENPEQRASAEVKTTYQRWMQGFAEALEAPTGEAIRAWGAHFMKITQSYLPGLFHT